MTIKIIPDKDTQESCFRLQPLEQTLEQWGRAVCQAGSSKHPCRGRVRTDTAVNTCIANKAVTEPTLFLMLKMIPDCLGNRDRRTRGGYFRPLAFEELFCALLGYSWGQLSLHPRSWIRPSLIRMGRGWGEGRMESKDWFWTVAPWLFRYLFLLLPPPPPFSFFASKLGGRKKWERRKVHSILW